MVTVWGNVRTVFEVAALWIPALANGLGWDDGAWVG